jgi:uncharacterized lipoprotein YehR (DUF1307 family)
VKKLTVALLSMVMVLSLSACHCTAEKQSVAEVENSHKLIATALMGYVKKDASLTEKEKGRFQTLVDTDNENIQKLKKALGE